MTASRITAYILGGFAVLAPAAIAADDMVPSEAHEERVRAAVAKAMPSVVAVETGVAQPKNGHYESFGSGVIVSPEGLVLSQRHVTHASESADPSRSHRPGREVRVILHDGRECRAKLLGAYRFADLSMLKILDPGPFPFSTLDANRAVALGDDVLKLGHPRGYRRGRPPVARLGRVLMLSESMFVSDCRVVGGDSGGPFFDLDGRLVGIIHASANTESLDNAKARLRRSRFLNAAWTNAFVATRFESLRQGELNTEVTSIHTADGEEVLPPDRWTQGREALEGWRGTVAEARRGVVAILDGGETVALGTVVEPGLIVTKASLLPFEPRCRLPDGRVVTAAVLGADAARDLALLKVDAEGLRPVAWADRPDDPAGSLLAAPGPGELPLAVGIVSVRRRELEGPYPSRVVPTPPAFAARPEAIGSAVEGRGYWIEYVEGPLADAGVRPGDVLLTVAGVPIRDHADLASCVRGRRAGGTVPVRVQRGREILDLPMVLRAAPSFLSDGRDDDFPTVFEYDLPLDANESGGPLVNREGRAVGVTIAEGAVGGMAIPAEQVRAVIAALRAGETPWPGERARPAAPNTSPAGESVTLSLDDLKVKLAERARLYEGLMVEYDATTEADVSPALMVAWSLVVVRDYRERGVVAFDGAKRLSRVTVPGDQPLWLPYEESRLPDALAGFTEARILPETQLVDGAPCVVLEAESRVVRSGEPEDRTETIWFDPQLGYAPRQWEKKVGDRLITRAVNGDFDEFAPGCWLPWDSTLSVGPPSWVAAGFRGEPAYTVRMRLRKARVGDLPAEWFKP